MIDETLQRDGGMVANQDLQRTLDAGHVGTWEWVPDEDRVVWSAGLQRLHGIEPGTFEGTIEAYQRDIHPDDLEHVLQTIGASLNSGADHRLEYRIVWPDGSIHWVEGRGTVFRKPDGSVERLMGICFDVTERKRTEESLSRRAKEQSYIYQLAERLQRTASPEQVSETALDSILEAVGCQRASLLLFNSQGVMDFVGWRGLSDGYRHAAAGHSPWKKGDRNPVPLSIGDILEAEIEPGLKGAICDEGIRALGFIPLVSDGELIGKFMVYYDQPHDFSSDEIELSLAMARQIAFCMDGKRAEIALQESQQSLSLALEAGRMGTWDWTVGSDRVEWSPSLEQIYGYEPGEFPGTMAAFIERIHPDDRRAITGAIDRNAARSHEHDVEHRIVWPDGSVRWVEGRGMVLRDPSGKPVRMVGVSVDITDRKRSERDIRFLADASTSLAELTNSEDTLQKLASLAVPAFADWCTVDLSTPDGTVNRVAVSHVDPEKVALAERLQRQYPPQMDETSSVWRVLRSGESEMVEHITDDMLTGTTSDRELLDTIRGLGLRSYMCVPLKARGKVLGAISFVSAESGRRYSREELAVAEDLAHRAAIAIENVCLYDELRENDRRKDAFLATLAHELRNPLAPMRYAVEIMKNSQGDPQVLEQTRETFERQLNHMVRLVDDLLDVSRINTDKLQLQKTKVELGAVLSQVVDTARPMVEARSHRITLQVSDEQLIVDADPTRINQVFSNLIHNATKFCNSSGVIAIEATRVDQSVKVLIRDNGIGISPEVLPTVFEMFRQADQSLERQDGGLGIGLTIVKRIVELHQGTITVASEGIGKGCEFEVTLPMDAQETELNDPTNEILESPRAQGRRILVVDDNVDAAQLVTILLGMQGYQTAVAHDGQTAVELAESFRPEVILMDIGLPGLNGYDAARKVREMPWAKDIFLAAITGWGQEEDRRKSREAGFDVHLVKPVGMEILKQLIANLPT